MKTSVKLMLPLGLLFVVAGILLRQFATLPDFADGLLFGVGIGLLVMALVIKSRNKSGA